MKIGPARFLGDPIHLPIEIIENITDHIVHFPDNHVRQYTLWSLCQISRDWYAVSIKHLYSSPALSTRNFDLFTRTICPPLNTRRRPIGLEDLVTELHMGHLAYTTSSSMTARLLRRTKKSLVLFESPSQSMSTSSLAPISKLACLQHLDLSRDKYDFDMASLLRAIRPLTALKFLSLPRFALFEWPDDLESLPPWPPALEYLESSLGLSDPAGKWCNFIDSLPDTLQTLSFQHLRGDGSYDVVRALDVRAPQVTNLLIEVQDGEFGFYDPASIYGLLTMFPCLVNLTIPGSFFDEESYLSLSFEGLGQHLQTLTIGVGWLMPVTGNDWDLEAFFLDMLTRFTGLQRLVVAVAFRDDNRDMLAVCDTLLAHRWPDTSDDNKGVFIQEVEKSRRWDALVDAERPPPPTPPAAWFPSTPNTAVVS